MDEHLSAVMNRQRLDGRRRFGSYWGICERCGQEVYLYKHEFEEMGKSITQPEMDSPKFGAAMIVPHFLPCGHIYKSRLKLYRSGDGKYIYV